MYLVQINTKVQGKSYEAALSYIDHNGEHSRIASGEGEAKDSRQRLELKALILGLERMTKPSEITVKTSCGYIKTGVEFLQRWEADDWKKSGGRPIANLDLWKRVNELRKKHHISVYVV